MKITEFEELASIDEESFQMFCILPFNEADADRHNHTSTTFQNGGPDTELGIINPIYTGYSAPLELDSNICEHLDNEVNNSAENLEKQERTKEDNVSYKSLLPFCIVVGLGTLFSQSISVYLSSQITVLEKAFGLSSSTSGFLLSANDIGFCATVLFASHFLKHSHIPRVIAFCIFGFGVAGLLTTLPHFISDERELTLVPSLSNSSSANDRFLCLLEGSDRLSVTKQCGEHSKAGSTTTEEGNKMVVVIIAISMFLQGVAKAPRTPLGSLYLDNNSKKEKTGFYLGVLMSISIFGPFIAITAGGLFNKLPVDLKETTLSPNDPRWIGAWWLGFVVFGACSIIISVPIFFFPASLRRDSGKNNVKAAEYANSAVIDSPTSCLSDLKDLPKSLLRVLREPVYMCNLFSACVVVFSFMALGSFGPKYIENQFHIPTWKANVLIGVEKLVTTVTGTLIGGILTRRLHLGLYGCVKMLLIARLVSFCCNVFNFLFGCDNPTIIGFHTTEGLTDLSCNCSTTDYLPICGDGQTYFSPCYAGCSSEIDGKYSNCTAVGSGEVTAGFCDTECSYLIPFLVLNALGSLIGTMTIAPSYMTLLRSVPEQDRSMAVGLQTFLMALLVFLPAPIVYGGVFDSMCLVWKSTCSGKGSCALYDVRDMRFRFTAVNVGLFVVGILLTCGTCLLARRKEADDLRRLEMSQQIKPPVPQPRLSLTKNAIERG